MYRILLPLTPQDATESAGPEKLERIGEARVQRAVTKPFVLEGKDLEINAAAPSGEMRIEILDAAGKPIPGFTLAEAEPLDGKDGVRLRPRWSSRSPGSLEGRTVRLRFTLENARLYACRVTKE